MSYGSYKFYQIIILAVTTKIFVRVTIMEISLSIISEAFFLFSLFLFSLAFYFNISHKFTPKHNVHELERLPT